MSYLNEIWKPIPGFEGFHEASDMGRIRGCEKLTLTKYGTMCIRKPRIYKQKPNHRQGYILVNLKKSGRVFTFLAHRLIAITFIPNPEGKQFVNHKNGIKSDNRVENLEWVTKSENAKHSFTIGLQCNKGEQHPKHKLTNDIVLEIRERYKPRIYGVRRLAADYGISLTHIKYIVKGKSWNHI